MSRLKFKNPLLHSVEKFYNQLILWSDKLQSIFILSMRITWGHQLFIIGKEKLDHIETTINLFASLHFRHPVFLSHFIGVVEIISGLCLLLGFASRLVAIPVAILMVTALSTAHAQHLNHLQFLFDPFLLMTQAPYPFLITALLVLAFGPGRVSVDAWLKRWSEKQAKY